MPDPLKNKDVRWRQRFQNFQKAFGQLSNVATLAQQRELTDLEQQGLIQEFEFTHELAWNTVKDFLESRGRSFCPRSPVDSTTCYCRKRSIYPYLRRFRILV